MTLVKICGIRSPEVALAAAEAGADFIGLMFAESKRRVTPQECYDIVEALKAKRTTQGPEAEFDGPARGDVSARSWFGVGPMPSNSPPRAGGHSSSASSPT